MMAWFTLLMTHNFVNRHKPLHRVQDWLPAITFGRDYLGDPRFDLLRGLTPTSCVFSDPH